MLEYVHKKVVIAIFVMSNNEFRRRTNIETLNLNVKN